MVQLLEKVLEHTMIHRYRKSNDTRILTTNYIYRCSSRLVQGRAKKLADLRTIIDITEPQRLSFNS